MGVGGFERGVGGICRAGATANSGEGLSIFGSAAERAVTVDRNLPARCGTAERVRSISEVAEDRLWW